MPSRYINDILYKMVGKTRFWLTILTRSKRNLIIFSTFLVLFLFWRTGNWYIFYYFLPEIQGWLPKIDERNETLQCKQLLQTARAILDGKEIPLPFGDQKTLWKFKNRVPMADPSINLLRRKNNVNTGSKGRKFLITFGHKCCWYSKRRAVQNARTIGGFDYTRAFNMDSLSVKFRQTHRNVLSERRGAGYWLWKPYLLLKVLLENMAEGDMVMYQDAGAYLIRSAYPLLKLAEKSESGVLVFTLDPGKFEHDYTKKDAMVLMNMNVPEVGKSPQRLASFVVLRKGCAAIQFVMEWLAYLSDRRIASDDENTMGLANPESFYAHRHDQSVLSLLSKKWGIPALRDPSQYGITLTKINYGPYEQIFQHDRFKS